MIAGFKAPAAKEMANGVDAPSDVVDEEDANQAAPKKTSERTHKRIATRYPASAGTDSVASTKSGKCLLIVLMPLSS